MEKETIGEFYAGVITWPASNCDEDGLKFLRNNGFEAEYIPHTETRYVKKDLLWLPGGFAYGDRRYKKATHEYTIDPGAQALETPVMEVIREAASNGDLILGICNGMQILAHAGLIPGRLEQNDSGEFYCDDVECVVTGNFLGDKDLMGKKLILPLAHGYGHYEVGDEEYLEMERNNQVFLRYAGFNPSGAYKDIAGVSNERGNVYGMMPHPERAEQINGDGRFFLESIKRYARTRS